MLVDPFTYAVSNEKEIKGFFGEYRYLSNFHVCDVEFEEQIFRSAENAYQAAKLLDAVDRMSFVTCSPNEAKKMGRKITLRPDWDNIRFDIMYRIVKDKFTRHKDLAQKLIDTKDAYLEETNSWGDRIWGVDYKTKDGANNLGKILMKVREEIK